MLRYYRPDAGEDAHSLGRPTRQAWNMEGLLRRLCRDPELLRDYRRDPTGTARRGGVLLGPEQLAQMRGLEEDAVTDVVLDNGGEDS